MEFTEVQKNILKSQIVAKLSAEQEVRKIVLFGSFVKSGVPDDIDIAVFQDSNEKYIPLSLKYRKLVREISKNISIDILPIKINAKGSFLAEVSSGETIYER